MVGGRWYKLCSQALTHRSQYGSNEKLRRGPGSRTKGLPFCYGDYVYDKTAKAKTKKSFLHTF